MSTIEARLAVLEARLGLYPFPSSSSIHKLPFQQASRSKEGSSGKTAPSTGLFQQVQQLDSKFPNKPFADLLSRCPRGLDELLQDKQTQLLAHKLEQLQRNVSPSMKEVIVLGAEGDLLQTCAQAEQLKELSPVIDDTLSEVNLQQLMARINAVEEQLLHRKLAALAIHAQIEDVAGANQTMVDSVSLQLVRWDAILTSWEQAIAAKEAAVKS